MKPLRSYTVSVAGWPSEYTKRVIARSAGKAKSSYWRDLREYYDEVPFTKMRAQVEPGFVEPPGFRRCMENRGIPFAQIDMRVRTDAGKEGRIVGHNDSANLDVIFDGEDIVHNCHPAWEISYFVKGEWIRSPTAIGKAT